MVVPLHESSACKDERSMEMYSQYDQIKFLLSSTTACVCAGACACACVCVCVILYRPRLSNISYFKVLGALSMLKHITTHPN